MRTAAINRRAFIGAGAASSVWLAAGNSTAATTDAVPKNYRRIAVEECFNIPEIAEVQLAMGVSRHAIQMSNATRKQLFEGLLEVEAGRLRDMDAAGVAMAVLSINAPGVQNLPDAAQATALARVANDRLAELVRKYPTRYGGLLSVAPQDPAAAAREIERGITQLGLNGVIINSHTNGEYLDDRKFAPIFEALVALGVPLYLHPREPSDRLAAAQDIPGFNVGWGYAAETGTHVARLITSGLFDRYPTLQLVLGHGGEGLPYFLSRLDNRFEFEMKLVGRQTLQRKPSEYLRQNIHCTTSGMNYWPQVRMMIEVLGIERVLFAADYPMEDMLPAVSAMDAAPLSAADRARFYHGNAERLFKLRS
ncbi:MAG: amidohydrolase family protein [Paludibacter sp.]